MDPVGALLVAQLAHRQEVVRHLSRTLTPDQVHRSLRPQGPNALWILGHLAEMARNTFLGCGGLDGEAPPDWHQLGPWPAPLDRFDQEAIRLYQWAESLDGTAWATPPAVPILPEFQDHLTTRAQFLSGHIFHLAYHAGQLGSLGKFDLDA